MMWQPLVGAGRPHVDLLTCWHTCLALDPSRRRRSRNCSSLCKSCQLINSQAAGPSSQGSQRSCEERHKHVAGKVHAAPILMPPLLKLLMAGGR